MWDRCYSEGAVGLQPTSSGYTKHDLDRHLHSRYAYGGSCKQFRAVRDSGSLQDLPIGLALLYGYYVSRFDRYRYFLYCTRLYDTQPRVTSPPSIAQKISLCHGHAGFRV